MDKEKNVLSVFQLKPENKIPILHHTLKEKAGDHNSESLQLGVYEIKDQYLILYSFWCRKGDAPVSPYGARIQKYQWKNNAFIQVSSQMYIEETRIDWKETIGIQFLFALPKNKQDEQEYIKYIREVEKKYQAEFVYGKGADTLIKLVKDKLKKKIQEETKDWIEIKSPFGVKI